MNQPGITFIAKKSNVIPGFVIVVYSQSDDRSTVILPFAQQSQR